MQKHQPNSDFIKNIEEAIKEYGNLACPNPNCHHKLVSKKKTDEQGNTTLEYHCKNQNCFYHQKRQIPIGIEAQLAPKDSIPFLQGVSYPKIFTVTGVILFGILSYMSYNLYKVNTYLENEITEHQLESPKINQNVSPSTIHNLESPRKEPPAKSISYQPEEVSKKIDLKNFAKETKTWVVSKNYNQARANFSKILENDDLRKSLFQEENQAIRLELVQLIGDSYDRNNNDFTFSFFERKKDFDLLVNFIKTFDKENSVKNILLGKAYLNLPNYSKESISLNQRKQMQLLALKHYLEAVKNGGLGTYKKTTIREINELAKAYQIFKYNPKKPKNFQSIEKLLKQGKSDMIQYRIEYVESIINRI